METLATLCLLLALVYVGHQATIATAANDSLLLDGYFTSPVIANGNNQIATQSTVWLDRISNHVTFVNANFYNQKWAVGTQALKLTYQSQTFQQLNAKVNSMYKVTLSYSLGFNETEILKTIPRSVGFQIMINDQSFRRVVPSSDQIKKVEIIFKGQQISNMIEFIGFSVNENNCNLDIFVMINGVSIIQIMNSTCVKAYEDVQCSNINQSQSLRVQVGQAGIIPSMRNAFKSGFGERYSRQNIKFSKKFQTPPKMSVALKQLDCGYVRLRFSLENITNQGFTLVIFTGWDSSIWWATASWIAFGI